MDKKDHVLLTTKQDNIFLIGIMGAGKTTVGKKLAKLMSYDFIDLDQEIVGRTGVSISHIFEVEGEKGFRQRETRILSEICSHQNTIISTGGGVVSCDENQRLMKKSGKIIYLDAPLHILWNRLKGCQHRPLLSVDNPRGQLEELLIERAPLYSNIADMKISISNDSALKTAHKIQKQLKEILITII